MTFECVLGAWQAHEREIRGYLVRHLRDPEQAEDLLQEILLKAIQQGGKFCVLDNPRAWLYRVAHNSMVDYLRGSRAHQEITDSICQPAEYAVAPIDELAACLERNLAELRSDERDLIRQCDLGGIKQKTYADHHGLSLTATKSRLHRARKKLRDALVRNCQVRFDDTGKVCCHVPRESET